MQVNLLVFSEITEEDQEEDLYKAFERKVYVNHKIVLMKRKDVEKQSHQEIQIQSFPLRPHVVSQQ